MGKLMHEELTYAIRGMLIDVYKTLGPGFREETYKTALSVEASRRGVSVAREVPIDVHYDGQIIDSYRLDLVVDGKVVLELKAIDELHPRHKAQLLSYLKASGMRVGLLVNFGGERLQVVRIVH